MTKLLIGVVHLPPFPGYPGSPGLAALIAHARRDLEALVAAGFDGILLENEHDQPHRVLAGPETLAVMTRVAAEIVAAAEGRIDVGVEILLNDPQASLAAAHAAGARFIRTDYFVDRMARDEYGGEMAIDPQGLLAFRRRIGADGVRVYADVQVKYARMIAPRPLEESTREAFAAGADGVVVTGTLTGVAPVVGHLRAAVSEAGGRPVVIGSGLTAANAGALMTHATGAIVGTGIMTNGVIDREKASALRHEVDGRWG